MDTAPTPTPAPAAECAYRFQRFRLLPSQRLLLDGEHPVKLGARAFDLLHVLVQQHGRVMGKHELMALVWPRLVVEENNLQVQVLALRKRLGHGAIATIPGRGYRFTWVVSNDGEAASEAPPPTAAAAASLPPLIGRDADVQTLLGLLAHHPLVTVAGAAGIGKTSLARRAAVLVGAACWIDLAGIDDPALVPNAVAQALGVVPGAGADVQAALLKALQMRSVLLVLDNAEHVLDAVAALVTALLTAREGAGVAARCLVTSQEVMKLSDEQVFRPGPLTLPDTDELASVQASGAVALFAARASLADPRFVVDDSNRSTVADICRRLDGIPLAIELAAARLPLLGVEGLRNKLDERFHVFTAGARAAMRRHQTLRAALEWSHGLLSTTEQRALQRLAVFAGGFTLEAAQALVEDEAVDEWDALELLGALVDKSMVVAEGHPVPRYRLLETTRLYALERLAQAGQTRQALLRHAVFFAELAHACGREIAQHGQGREALLRLDAERDNLLHALAWCGSEPAASDATGVGVQLLAALRSWWSSRGMLAVGSRLGLLLLEKARGLPMDDMLAQALGSTAQQLGWQGRHAEGDALLRQLLHSAEAAGLDDHAIRTRVQLAHRALDAGDLDGGEQLLATALSQARRGGHERARGAALNGLLGVASARHDFARVVLLGDELLALRRALGQHYHLCTALLNLAVAAQEADDPVRALGLLQEAAPLVAGTGSQRMQGLWLQALLPVVNRVPRRPGAAEQVQLAGAVAAGVRDAVAERITPLAAAAEAQQAALRAELGESAYAVAWSQGQALPIDVAASMAVSWLSDSAPSPGR